jgi:phage baseplate assembly protein gpV
MSTGDDRGLEDILDRLRTRFYGKYRGIVTSVDPATMRIKALVPAVLGDTETGWCMPCVPYAGPKTGFAFLPAEGSGVWIEFEGGDVSYPIWVGGYWREGEVPAGAAENVRVIVTAKMLTLKLDDGGQGEITLSDQSGNTVTLGQSGIKVANGQESVVVSSTSVSVNAGALEVK